MGRRRQRKPAAAAAAAAARGYSTTSVPSAVKASMRSSAAEQAAAAAVTVWCDLDGVLCDFEAGYLKLTGLSPACFDSTSEMWKRLRDATSCDFKTFFANLPWCTDGQALWQSITTLTAAASCSFGIVTGGACLAGAAAGKREWVARHLGRDIPVCVVDTQQAKARYAGPGRILIDDRDSPRRWWTFARGAFVHHTGLLSTQELLGRLLQHRPIDGTAGGHDSRSTPAEQTTRDARSVGAHVDAPPSAATLLANKAWATVDVSRWDRPGASLPLRLTAGQGLAAVCQRASQKLRLKVSYLLQPDGRRLMDEDLVPGRPAPTKLIACGLTVGPHAAKGSRTGSELPAEWRGLLAAHRVTGGNGRPDLVATHMWMNAGGHQFFSVPREAWAGIEDALFDALTDEFEPRADGSGPYLCYVYRGRERALQIDVDGSCLAVQTVAVLLAGALKAIDPSLNTAHAVEACLPKQVGLAWGHITFPFVRVDDASHRSLKQQCARALNDMAQSEGWAQVLDVDNSGCLRTHHSDKWDYKQCAASRRPMLAYGCYDEHGQRIATIRDWFCPLRDAVTTAATTTTTTTTASIGAGSILASDGGDGGDGDDLESDHGRSAVGSPPQPDREPDEATANSTIDNHSTTLTTLPTEEAAGAGTAEQELFEFARQLPAWGTLCQGAGNYHFLLLAPEWQAAAGELVSRAEALPRASDGPAADLAAVRTLVPPSVAEGGAWCEQFFLPRSPHGLHITVKPHGLGRAKAKGRRVAFQLNRLNCFRNPHVGRPSSFDTCYIARWYTFRVVIDDPMVSAKWAHISFACLGLAPTTGFAPLAPPSALGDDGDNGAGTATVVVQICRADNLGDVRPVRVRAIHCPEQELLAIAAQKWRGSVPARAWLRNSGERIPKAGLVLHAADTLVFGPVGSTYEP